MIPKTPEIVIPNEIVIQAIIFEKTKNIYPI